MCPYSKLGQKRYCFEFNIYIIFVIISPLSLDFFPTSYFQWVSCFLFKLENLSWLGAVAQACNPSTLEGQGGWITRLRDQDHPGQEGETPSLLKIQKLAGHGGAPVVPATREAEAGELLEPRRRRLRWAEIAPLHSSLGNKSKTPSQKKPKNKTEILNKDS